MYCNHLRACRTLPYVPAAAAGEILLAATDSCAIKSPMRSEDPPLLRLLRDSRGLGEAARLLWKWPRLREQPRGEGEPVLVLPGFATGDTSTLVLRSYLRWLGYRPYGWGQGINRGDVRKLLHPMIGRTHSPSVRHDQPVQLIGWSLGGVIAREVARERADLVAGVITLGSPVVGGAKYT